MIPIAKPLLGDEEKRAVLEVLESGKLAQGEKVAAFEKAFAQFIGVKHAIATSNGTTALHAAILAYGIGKNDEVITTPFSFIATANAIVMAGATPVFVDIEKNSFNIDPELIESAITPKTKAILPVHLFGRPANMEKIMAIAMKHNLVVIEDACQAHGAEFVVSNGDSQKTNILKSCSQKVGSFGTGCFSFYPTKNMTTGEGGIITTNDDEVAAKLRRIISHGSEKRYHHLHLGYNYRMTDISAAIGLEQLKKLPAFNQKRIEHAKYLNQKFQQNGLHQQIIVPELVDGHVFHQYTIRVPKQNQLTRDLLLQQLTTKEIGTNVFYPIPIHKQQAYPHLNYLSFSHAEKAAEEVLSLPIHPSLTKEDLNKVVEAVTLAFKDGEDSAEIKNN